MSAAPIPAPNASRERAIPRNIASIPEIVPERSISASVGRLRICTTRPSALISNATSDFGSPSSCLCFVSSSSASCGFALYMAHKPIAIKIVPPTYWVATGDKKYASHLPIYIETRITSAEHAVIIITERAGILMRRIPYVTPTPNPSRLTAKANASSEKICSTPFSSFSISPFFCQLIHRRLVQYMRGKERGAFSTTYREHAHTFHL
ncbi:hypothetical protein D1872_134210 [compost metagenome]